MKVLIVFHDERLNECYTVDSNHTDEFILLIRMSDAIETFRRIGLTKECEQGKPIIFSVRGENNKIQYLRGCFHYEGKLVLNMQCLDAKGVFF